MGIILSIFGICPYERCSDSPTDQKELDELIVEDLDDNYLDDTINEQNFGTTNPMTRNLHKW